MKKSKKIFIEVIITLVFILCIILIYINQKDTYKNRKTIQTIINNVSMNEKLEQNNSIELEDLSIELSGINYYQKINTSTKNVLDFNIEFKSKNGLNLNSVVFDYIIFDNNDNILNTSLLENLHGNEKYIKGFLKDKYQETLFLNLNEHCIFTEKSEHDNITENLNNVSKTMSCSLDMEINNYKQIAVRILNLKYNFENQEYKTLQNTDLEFILNEK